MHVCILSRCILILSPHSMTRSNKLAKVIVRAHRLMRRMMLLVMHLVLVEHLRERLAIWHLVRILVVHTPPYSWLLYEHEIWTAP